METTKTEAVEITSKKASLRKWLANQDSPIQFQRQKMYHSKNGIGKSTILSSHACSKRCLMLRTRQDWIRWNGIGINLPRKEGSQRWTSVQRTSHGWCERKLVCFSSASLWDSFSFRGGGMELFELLEMINKMECKGMDSNLLKQACNSHILNNSTHPCSTKLTLQDNKCHRISKVLLTGDQISPKHTCKTLLTMDISNRSRPIKRKKHSYPTSLSNSSQVTSSNKLSSKCSSKNHSLNNNSSNPPRKSPSNSTRKRCASRKSW